MENFLLNTSDALCWRYLDLRPQWMSIFRGARRLTYSHHAELHVLLHHHDVVVLRQDEGAVERAAVRPRVVVGNVMKVNGPGLNVSVGSPVPLQAAEEILVEDVSGGVVIVENLRKYTVETTRIHSSFFVKNTGGWRAGTDFMKQYNYSLQ